MKLQYRAWLLVLAIIGLAAIAAMFGVRHIVSDSFSQLEAEQADRESERARRLLAQQLDHLGAVVRDYAWWADAAEYAEGLRPAFVDQNFSPDSLASLRVSEVLVVDTRAGVVVGLRRADDALGPLDAETQRQLLPLAERLLVDPDARAYLGSFQVHGGRLRLTSAAVIHDPDRPFRPSGVMLMVRHFDDDELQRFADVLMTPVDLVLPPPSGAAFAVPQPTVAAQALSVPAAIRDHTNEPVAWLVLSLDRRLAQAAHALAWAGMGLALLAAVLAVMLLVPALDRVLLRRLQQLHDDVRQLTLRGPVQAGPIPVRGKDEIGQLATAINGLVGRVRDDHRAQQEAHERQEALQVQLAHSQKTEALGRLTGGIAHDFNNSLAAITGWVRLASEDLAGDHPSRESLQQALKATRYADGLMRQLLAFGRQAPPKLSRLHWGRLIEETRQLVASSLTRDCEIVAEVQVEDDEVDADPTQLQQVMVNLLINAADAMQGKGRITLRLQPLVLPPPDGHRPPDEFLVLPAGRYLVLAIEDQGPGVPPELRQRLFEPFYTTKAKGKGTGLGLSVAQGIVARHLGAIALSSESGQGACFLVCLPVSRRDPAIPSVTVPGDLPREGRRLLFVDDDQLVRHAWGALLERQGWQVTRARDGEEAWAQFAQTGHVWDVVLTDQSMPRLDGVGLARRIREHSSPCPVVLMSGHVNEVSAEDLQNLFAAVLHKPVEATELERVLQAVLSRPSAGAPLS
jgi:two-component system cell cycle sensor histidine kinase/response regulator CckA